MSLPPSAVFLLGAIGLAPIAAAQPLVVHGEPALTAKAAAPAVSLRLPPGRALAKRLELPDASTAAEAEVRAQNFRSGRSKMRPQLRRVVIGVVRQAEEILQREGSMAWIPVDGGLAAQVSLRSPQAESLRLALDLSNLPPDAEMVFFGSSDASRLEGPVRVGDIADRTLPWWTPITEGDEQTVEVFVPRRGDASGLDVRVARASHLLTTPSSGFTKRMQDIGKAGSCNIDVPCASQYGDSAYRSAAGSVAQMVFVDGSFSALCTGTLLNDADTSSQVPWFYSANHCFENESAPYKTPAQMQAVANSLNTLWDFQADACVGGRGSGQPLSHWSQSTGGATFLYNNVQADALLLRLRDSPPATAFYSGWDANPVSSGASVTSIHHPQGDLKKTSDGIVQRFAAPGPGGSFIEVIWNRGTTEGGSSGAGLWTYNGSQYLFRGGLWGGSALCTNPGGSDFYSRFDQVYPALSGYLGASTGGSTDYTDLWWNPGESGWGLNLIQHPSRIIFGVWYTYESDGTRTWFVMPSGSWTSQNTYTGPLYETAGPHMAQTFDTTKVRVSPVGSAILTFSDSGNGTFSYSVKGASGVKSITRQSF